MCACLKSPDIVRNQMQSTGIRMTVNGAQYLSSIEAGFKSKMYAR
jgi:hypothetical protein